MPRLLKQTQYRFRGARGDAYNFESAEKTPCYHYHLRLDLGRPPDPRDLHPEAPAAAALRGRCC